MNKGTIIWLIIAGVFLIAGTFICIGVMVKCEFDFAKLGTEKYETNEHKITDAFESIIIDTDCSDITFVPSEEGSCKIVCYEKVKTKHMVEVQDKTLNVHTVDTRKWYDYISIISIGNPTITVYLPETQYDLLHVKNSTGNIEVPKDFEFQNMDISVSTGDVKNYASASEKIKIKTSTGNILNQNTSVKELELSVSTGKVVCESVVCDGNVKIAVSTGKSYLTDVSCGNLVTTGNTGGITLTNVIANKKISIQRTTGDVKFDKCDGSEIFVETDTGDVSGNLLTDKIFIIESNTGSVNVPKTTTGGKCEIVTDTGDIKIDTFSL